MATTAAPSRTVERPNIPSAAVRFPAIKDYEQVDREIAGTLRPTLGWFAALGIAILTYLTISSTFLYIGLNPDIAILRDRERNPVRKAILATPSLGWRNSDREWRHFTRAYLFLAAFATPLVLSVHS